MLHLHCMLGCCMYWFTLTLRWSRESVIEVWSGVVVALLSTWMIWVVVSRPLTHSRVTHSWSSVSTKGPLGDFQSTRKVWI